MPSTSPCHPPRTNADKSWPYIEYYIGDRDEEQRKSGQGTIHWSGAELLAWYTGELLRDTMHGVGEYCRRYRGAKHQADSYEGHFYNNSMHGYGLASYSNGKVFRGLYYNNVRWGPGIETYARLCENVGLWRGLQLVRLTWKPDLPSVAPDLMAVSNGRTIVEKHRHLLVATRKSIGETNLALELLKQCGAQPMTAALNWTKLYPKNCTDKKSQLFYSDAFDRAYYGNEIVTLDPYNEDTKSKTQTESQKSNSGLGHDQEIFYSWNNNDMIIHMMQHCYQHSSQLANNIDLRLILNGPRGLFKPAAEHELDCRTFLMASFLGHIKNVAQLINEYDVNPNVTDMLGNSALMYAVCGNQADVIHFLVEAGAGINNYNDSCCAPLGVALINYACAQLDIPPSEIVRAILPATSTTTSSIDTEKVIFEWKINRSLGFPTSPLHKKDLEVNPAKTGKNMHVQNSINKRSRSVQSFGSKIIKKTDHNTSGESNTDTQVKPSDFLIEENRMYFKIMSEFQNKVNDLFMNNRITPVKYIFGVNDMVLEINTEFEEEQRKVTDKKDAKKDISKILKEVLKKPSGDVTTLTLDRTSSIDSKVKIKNEQLEVMKATIMQLLVDGADPREVRCPQPALLIALIACDANLVKSLVKYGVNVNEVYPQTLDYTPLDIAVSQPLTPKNLEVIRTLLEIGADPKHRLPINNPDIEAGPSEPGPTLLHAVLIKEIENEANEELRHRLLELLLKYGCDPITQYKGRAAMDIAMSKNLTIFDIFIQSPHTDLNAIINHSQQSILLKMFYLPFCRTIGVSERLQMLTNLLLFGADPLLKCQNEDNVYDNLFVYVKTILTEMEKAKSLIPAKQDDKKNKTDAKGKSKTGGLPANRSILAAKAVPTDESSDYKQAMSLVTNCARLLIIRWIQAKLLKELIVIVDRFKHRHWNMILKEYKNSKCLGLWLNPGRCLEIWDILKTTKSRTYNDNKVLKHVLCIVLFYFKKMKNSSLAVAISSKDKASIESEVTYIVRENKLVTKVREVLKRPYVTPELTPVDEISKFNVCFECAIPLKEEKIPCCICRLVDFCSYPCMRINIERYNCHPCSKYLKKKYFPMPEFSNNDGVNDQI